MTSALQPHHVKYLAERSVDANAASAASLRSVDAATAAQLLGVTTVSSGGIAIPYPNVNPPYHRVRMDNGDPKFMAPAGREVPVYVPPNMPAAQSLVVVEGPIKALALCAVGIPAVGLGGAGTTLTTGVDRRLNSSWGVLSVTGKEVVILFDSNRASNPNVARDEARLAVALERAGAIVKVAHLPHRHDGEAWGPDDFLAAEGIAKLTHVITSANAADPTARVHELTMMPTVAHQTAAARALLGDLPFRFSVLERGQGAHVAVVAALKPFGIKADDLKRAMTEARGVLARAMRPYVQQPTLSGVMYSVQDRKLVMRVVIGEKETLLSGEEISHRDGHTGRDGLDLPDREPSVLLGFEPRAHTPVKLFGRLEEEVENRAVLGGPIVECARDQELAELVVVGFEQVEQLVEPARAELPRRELQEASDDLSVELVQAHGSLGLARDLARPQVAVLELLAAPARAELVASDVRHAPGRCRAVRRASSLACPSNRTPKAPPTTASRSPLAPAR